jgi:hypothetical protein
MPAPRALGIPRYIVPFFVADIALIVFYLVNMLLGQPYEFPTQLVDLDREANLPTWHAAAQLYLSGALLAVWAADRRVRAEGKVGWALLLLPAVFLFLSLDETASIHEWLGRVGERAEARLLGRSVHGPLWVFMTVPPLAVSLWICGRIAKPVFAGRRRLVTMFAAGFSLLIVSAGLDIVQWAVRDIPAALQTELLIEESGEMLAGTLLLWATCELVRSHGVWFASTSPPPQIPGASSGAT